MNESPRDDLAERLRALNRELVPDRDLWPAIQAELDSRAETEAPTINRPRWRSRVSLLAAGLAIATSTMFWIRSDRGPGWEISPLAGVPRIDSAALNATGSWRQGQWLETDNYSQARFAVGQIGEVRLEPNSRLRLLRTNDRDHRLELERGTLHAWIWAPPRLFFVETPSAIAADLGCAYSLSVDDGGASTLHVTSGYVALAHGKRESLVPAGMTCITRRGVGPGTPFSPEADPRFLAAIQRFDFESDKADALRDVLARASSGDEVSLWHVLRRSDVAERAEVFDKLASLYPPSGDITREGIVNGDEAMMDRWGEDLGLGPALAAK
jgi:hypothetical protein